MTLLWTGVSLSTASALQPDDLTPVTAAQVEARQTNSSYQLLGTVTPNRTATLGFAVAGRVSELHAKRGKRLDADDPVADLRTEVIKIELDAARAELRLVQQQLAELETGSRPEDIAEGKARMEAAKAVSRRAASQLGRMTRLNQSGAASADEIDVATAEADSSKQLLQAAEIAYQRLVAGPRQEQVAQAQARVDLQSEQVRLLEDRLTKHALRAPWKGYVTQEFIEAGSWATQGTAVVELMDLETVEVEVAVPATQVVNLQIGQSIRIEHEQRPGELLVGTLDRIVPSASTRARTFPVLIRLTNVIKNDVPLLMNGLIVRVDLPIGQRADLTFVPTDAIVLKGAQKRVFVIDTDTSASSVAKTSDAEGSRTVFLSSESGQGGPATGRVLTGRVRSVPVKLGVADGMSIAVIGDLKPGQWVVTHGNEGLSEGHLVEFATQGD